MNKRFFIEILIIFLVKCSIIWEEHLNYMKPEFLINGPLENQYFIIGAAIRNEVAYKDFPTLTLRNYNGSVIYDKDLTNCSKTIKVSKIDQNNFLLLSLDTGVIPMRLYFIKFNSEGIITYENRITFQYFSPKTLFQNNQEDFILGGISFNNLTFANNGLILYKIDRKELKIKQLLNIPEILEFTHNSLFESIENSQNFYILSGYSSQKVGEFTSFLIKINSNFDIIWQISIPNSCINSATKTLQKNSYLLSGSRFLGNSQKAYMLEISESKEILWEKMLNTVMNSVFYKGLEGKNDLNFGICHMVSQNSNYDALVVLEKSKMAWRKIASGKFIYKDLLINDKNDIISINYDGLFTKNHIDSMEYLSTCVDQCYPCGAGFFWNYTNCQPCSFGCLDCLNETYCNKCSNKFMKSEIGECENIPVCDCKLKNLTSECEKNCTTPNCALNISSPIYNENNVQICNCTGNMHKNMTHCIPILEICPILCVSCINIGKFIGCLKCENLTGVYSKPLGGTQDLVDCKCNFEYEFNGTNCIKKTVMKSQDNSLWIIILIWILLVLLIIGVIIWIISRKCIKYKELHDITMVSLANKTNNNNINN